MEDTNSKHNLIMKETIMHSRMNASIPSIVRASQNDLARIEEKIRTEISCLPKKERLAIYANIKNYFEFWVKLLEKEV